jgi:5'-nucleotidase
MNGKGKSFLKFKRLFFILFAALFLNLFRNPLIQAAPRVQFSIVYTNDVMREVEPCERFRNSLGGVAKKSTLISQIKKEGEKILLLDTGNLIFRKPPQTETKRRDVPLRVDLLVQSYNDMGYDVVNVGEKDLMMGLKFLSDLSQMAKFPFISANLADKKTQKEVFKPYVIKEIVGLRIGIFGLLGDLFNPTPQENDPGLIILEPLSTSKALTKSLREHCDLIIVLSQMDESKDKKLARENREIDLILGGGGESKRAVIERVNKVPIYRLEPRGGYSGRIDYSLVDVKKPVKFIITSDRDEMKKRLETLITRSMQIKSEMVKSGKQEETKVRELRFLESKQRELEKTLPTFEDKNFHKHMSIPVQISVKDDPSIIKRVEIYRAESARLYRPKVAPLPEKELPEKEMIARITKESSLIGAIPCKRCHETNYMNWLKTKHAKASQTIVASPKYSQEECLMCHSTGYGKMGEYATVEEIPPYLRGVQCEARHGEGKGHPGKGGIEKKVTLGICRNCHTKDQSPAFNYIAYLEKISCKISK